jgi:amino acid transporter
MQAAAGPITPLIYLAAMLMIMPTAISYALLNRKAPSSAAAASWVWTAIHPAAGFQVGLLMATYFCMSTIAVPLIFSLFFRDLLALLHITLLPGLTLFLGILISTLPVAWVCLCGAEVSITSTVRLMVIEIIVVIALSITILISRSAEPGAINLMPFDPHNGSGLSGFWIGMILGVLAFCGFDVVSTAAEEANAPQEHVPKAILLTVVGISLFWAINAWVFTLSTPTEQVKQYAAEGLTAVTPVAEAYWGGGKLIIILTAFTGLGAVYISSLQGASRIVFSLARKGLLPSPLANLSGEKRVPTNAVLSVLVAVIVFDFATLYVLDNGMESFTWWANALVFFATLTFLSVNIANSLFFWRRARLEFSILKNLLIPIVGVLLNTYLIYAAFFSALWSGNARTGKSVVIACVALLALQVAVVACVHIRRPKALHRSAGAW